MTSDELEGVFAVVARLGLSVRHLESVVAQQAELIAEKNAELEQATGKNEPAVKKVPR